MRNYVIIGGSAAAVGCVEGIRSVDRDGLITIVSGEPYHTYSRPLISYLLCGKTDEQRMKYRPDSFYHNNRVKFIAGMRARSVDAAARKVKLESGECLAYDELLLATGSSPFIPPIEGLGGVTQKFTFMSLDDAKALDAALAAQPEARVLIMGAGLIGLKCAEGIANKAGHITVVDMADHILPSILDADAAQMVQEHIESKGIEFILSDSVKACSAGKAALASGRTLDFDILVVAVGVRPNTSLAEKAGAKVERGIVTDLHCRTTAPHIWAAGDCAQSLDAVTGQSRVLALLPNAYMQGECAGKNMAGGDAVYDHAIAMNAIGFFGLHIITAGSYDGEAWTEKTEKTYKKLITKDNRLVGYMMIGDVARAGIYTSLVRDRVDLHTIDFELIRKKPQLMAFSRQEREKLLGGVAR